MRRATISHPREPAVREDDEYGTTHSRRAQILPREVLQDVGRRCPAVQFDADRRRRWVPEVAPLAGVPGERNCQTLIARRRYLQPSVSITDMTRCSEKTTLTFNRKEV